MPKSSQLSQNAIFSNTLTRSNGLGADATIDQLSGQRLDEVSGFKEEALPAFSDQILPFDITLAGTNEMGAATTMGTNSRLCVAIVSS